LERDVQRPRRRSSVAATATAVAGDDDDFKLVVFRIGNADFDLAVWVCVRGLDFAGDEEVSTTASEAGAGALDSESVFVEWGIIRRFAMLLVGWGSLSAEKKVRWRGH
jgi:hypothetical protein